MLLFLAQQHNGGLKMFTDYWMDKINESTTGQIDLPQITDLKIALFTAETGLQTNTAAAEYTNTNYVRQQITFGAGNVNTIAVSFPGMTAALTPSHIALIGTVGADVAKILSWKATGITELPISKPMYFAIGEITMAMLVTTCP